MNNEERYYVPQIEELCYGFEVEVKTVDKSVANHPIEEWDKITVDLEFIANMLDSEIKLRVKRLDREDIESLGWEFMTKDIFFNGIVCLNFKDNNGVVLQLWGDGKISICLKGVYVDIKIANKHELKVLMKQLGV